MVTVLKKIVIGAALIGSALVIAGCSRDEEESLEQSTPQEIFQLGQSKLTKGEYKQAADTFGEIERIYPYSDWARRGTLMMSNSYNMGRDYELSRGAAERFLQSYPGDQDAPYAQYLIALSYYDQLDSKGRDRSNAVAAWKALRQVQIEYGDSEYAKTVEFKIDLTANRLAAKEMEIGRYYLKKKQYNAALSRFLGVVDNSFLDALAEETSEGETVIPEYNKATNHVPEALHRLVEVYLAIGMNEKAFESAAILAHNFRGSKWYDYTYTLLQNVEDNQQSKPGMTDFFKNLNRQTLRGEWL